jgi:hypothetical protein
VVEELDREHPGEAHEAGLTAGRHRLCGVLGVDFTEADTTDAKSPTPAQRLTRLIRFLPTARPLDEGGLQRLATLSERIPMAWPGDAGAASVDRALRSLGRRRR